MKIIFIPFILFLFIGCSHSGEFRGQFVDRNGYGIADAEIEFWRNAPFFPGLAAKVATTETKADGYFEAVVDSPVHFIVAHAPGHYGSLGSFRLGWRIDQRNLLVQERAPSDEGTLEQNVGDNPIYAPSVER
jgi:hypothetical protein